MSAKVEWFLVLEKGGVIYEVLDSAENYKRILDCFREWVSSVKGNAQIDINVMAPDYCRCTINSVSCCVRLLPKFPGSYFGIKVGTKEAAAILGCEERLVCQ